MNGVVDIPLSGQPLDGLSEPGAGRRADAVLHGFLAGPENRLVAPAVRSVLEHLGDGCNPLVLYGPSGTGKSHLAHGMAACWKARKARSRVISTTAVDFARELAEAIETQAVSDLRRRYREAELLVFEDVGRLAGKRAAQEEFVHTMDAVIASGGRLVVTASAAPGELCDLMPALSSRLTSGLAVRLALPEPATRLAMLHRLARLRKIDLSDSVARILAEGLDAGLPELLGALVQLEMPARLDGRAIDAQSARRFLAERSGSRRPALRQIAAAVAKQFSLLVSDLRGPSRRREVVLARDVAMYLARLLTDQSLERIGHYFGGRDHSTVMHGCRKADTLRKTDPAVRRAIETMQKKWQVG